VAHISQESTFGTVGSFGGFFGNSQRFFCLMSGSTDRNYFTYQL